MSIRGIKNKADGIYMKYRKQIIPEFFYVGYVGLLAQYLRSGLFSFFVSLFLCPIAHGYVKCAMKLVDDEHPLIDYHQSMIGIIEFPRVAPAYLMRKAIILFITLLCALPILLSVHSLIPEFSLEWISSLGNTLIQTEFFVPNFEEIHVLMSNSLLILNIIVCIFVYLFLTALFTPVPYFLMLYVSYFIRHVIYWMITGLCMLVIGSLNEILTLFCMVTSLFLYIEIFKGRFEIAKYLFYQEIRGDHDERNRGN